MIVIIIAVMPVLTYGESDDEEYDDNYCVNCGAGQDNVSMRCWHPGAPERSASFHTFTLTITVRVHLFTSAVDRQTCHHSSDT